MDIATILTWFKRGCKPTEAQFAATFQSFRHKDDTIPMGDVSGLTMALANKSENGHTHTLAEITDYDGGDKEVINAMVAQDSTELEAFTKTAGMYYILLSDDLLYQCVHDEDTDTDTLAEVEPDGKVVYSAYDVDENLHIYLYNVPNLMFQDVTNEQVDKTIYTNNLDSLITRQLANGVYSVVYINSGIDDNTYGDAYTLTVGDGSIASRVLECRTGWAQTILVDETYQWQWHNYSYNGHGHQQSDVEGLTEALAGKANVGHNHDSAYAPLSHTHSEYLTQHQDISDLQSKTDNSLLTTAKNIVSAINELWNKFADYALANHNHDGVYQPVGNYLTQHQDISGKQDKTDNTLPTTSKTIVGAIAELWNKFTDYALSNHNHDGVYQPAGNYAASDHTHSQYLTQHQDISGKQDKTDNSLLTTVKTIVGAINELWNKFADYLKGIQHVTYAQLVTLRNAGGLVPGQRYRITDYTCTTTQPETRSAGHVFDIIVSADDANTLNENARAVKHACDTYFNGSKLSAWKLKYSLDNDTARFYWADPENGKGVVYYLEDEFENKGNYDFKNFQKKRYKVTDISADGSLSSLDGQYVGFDDVMHNLEIEDPNDYIWAYAASCPSYTFNEDTEELELDMTQQQDATLNKLPEGTAIDEDGGGYAHPVIYCKGNKFPTRQIAMNVDDEMWVYPQRVSDIVLFCYPKYFEGDDDIPARVEFENSADNVFAPDCDYITAHGVFARNTFLTAYTNIIFGGSVGRSIFKGDVSCCTFGGDIYGGTFGGNIGNTTFGGYIRESTFGGDIWNTTFGGDIRNTTFGGEIVDTTFGGYIECATFGGGLSSCTFGGYINRCTFGGDIWNTTFGGDIGNTTFGGYIDGATFGGNLYNCHIHGYLYSISIGSSGETWRNLVIDPGVEYVAVTCAESGDSDITNVHIFSGVCGTDSSPLSVSIPNRNNALLEIKPDAKEEILV